MLGRLAPALRIARSAAPMGVLPLFAAGVSANRTAVRCFATASDDSHPDFQKKTTEVKKQVDYTATIAVLEKLIKEHKVVVFMKGEPDAPQCGFSGRTAAVFERVGLWEYAFVNVLEKEAAREAVKKMTDWPTIPQVFINGEFVGGCDIMEEMEKSGELAEMLKKIGCELEQ